MKHVEWSKKANIYEVNIRQFTPEGTFAAFESHLPRLQRMGVDILWLMPIQPIGVHNSKGTLWAATTRFGDYVAVNPDFGTLADFKHLVKAIHDAGLYIIGNRPAPHSKRPSRFSCWPKRSIPHCISAPST